MDYVGLGKEIAQAVRVEKKEGQPDPLDLDTLKTELVAALDQCLTRFDGIDLTDGTFTALSDAQDRLPAGEQAKSDVAVERREREKLAKKINEDAERRKRHRQFGEAVALGVTSTAAAVALLVFDVIHAAVPVICLITAAASLDVAALRTGFGARRGGAIITWVALIVGIAALVAAFVLAPSDSVPRP